MRLRRRLIAGHLADLARLSVPVMVSRVGILTMAVVDTIIVGRFASDELGFLSLGVAIYLPYLLTVMGLMVGNTVFAAQAYGRGDLGACGGAWRRSLPIALAFGAFGLGLGLHAEGILLATGQSAEMSAGAGRVFLILALGYPGNFLYFAAAFLLEGIRRPRPAAVAIIVANAVNLAGDLVLVNGMFGLPALGAEGSAWTTTGVRTALAVALMAYVWWMPDRRRLGVRTPADWRWRGWRLQRTVGYAAAVAIAVEVGAFTVVNLFAGWLGVVQLASFTIVLNVLSVLFMAANGIGTATSVRVANAFGRGNRTRWVMAGWSGLAATLGIMAVAGVAMAVFAEGLVGIHTNDPAVLAAAVPVMLLASLIPLADGGQALMSRALWGRSDVWVPTLLQAIAFLACMLPLALWLGFGLERGVAGLFEAMIVSIILLFVLLCGRFAALARRP